MRVLIALCALCLLVVVFGLLGIVGGLIALFATVIVSIFSIFGYMRRRTRLAGTTGGGTTTPATAANRPSWMKSALGIGTLGLLAFWIFTWSYTEYQKAKAAPPPPMQWFEEWEKPIDYGGRLFTMKKSGKMPFTMLRNDNEVMEFIVPPQVGWSKDPSNFIWEKDKPMGIWRDGESSAWGYWYVRVDPLVPNRYTGKIRDHDTKIWSDLTLTREVVRK
jgi:hypothetical protein